MYKIQRLKNIYVVICCCCLVTVWLFRNPMDYSPPCSLARGIFQAKILEWVAVSFSSESFRPRNQTQVSCISYNGRWVLYPLSHQESPVYSYSFVCVCVCVCVCNFAKIFRYLKFILKILSSLKKYFLYLLGFDFFNEIVYKRSLVYPISLWLVLLASGSYQLPCKNKFVSVTEGTRESFYWRK